MATILIYASVNGYKKYQQKRANSFAEHPSKSKKNRKSISSLVIPSIASANIVPAHEFMDDSSLPEYNEKASGEPPKYTAPYPPDSISPPTRLPPPPPVMLGLTLCTSPASTASELDGNSSIGYLSLVPSEMQGNLPIDCEAEVLELACDEQLSEPLSPAPLHVVKRGSAAPLPELTYSSDESEEEHEEAHQAPQKSSLLKVPESAEELDDFEPPPIPPKSPKRKLRVISS